MGYEVARPRDVAQAPGCLLQQGIAGGVAEGVVDALEAIEVEEEDGQALASLARACDLALEALDGIAYIPQLGRIGSLNVATATAIALYEARRQSWP